MRRTGELEQSIGGPWQSSFDEGHGCAEMLPIGIGLDEASQFLRYVHADALFLRLAAEGHGESVFLLPRELGSLHEWKDRALDLRWVTLDQVCRFVGIDHLPVTDVHHSFGNGRPGPEESPCDLRQSQNSVGVGMDGLFTMPAPEVLPELQCERGRVRDSRCTVVLGKLLPESLKVPAGLRLYGRAEQPEAAGSVVSPAEPVAGAFTGAGANLRWNSSSSYRF